MCSVPGLPTTGSEVPVFITKVNLNPSCGLVELWVNMDDGRKPAYEQMKKEIQIPKRMFYGLEGNPGDFCLVCISDTWHRARIVSIQIETYNLFLIDQGQPHIATSEALAWANNEGFFLPPEVECCILANVLSLENNWPEKATKFLKSLPGKKFKGLVQHVLMPERMILLDIPIVSKHMCKFGVAKKIPGGDFKSFVLKFLHLPKDKASQVTEEQNLNVTSKSEKHGLYFYPELSTDTFVTINVTEVNDPQNFFCKLQIFYKAVEVLSEEIHQYYEESSDLTGVQPKTCGEPCAARGTNGKWHRSLLKQNIVTDEGAVEVLHVDEGKTELIQVRDIRPLHEKFLKLPVVTYVCSLGGLKGKDTRWTTDQTDYLKSVLLNQTVMARFDHHNIHQNVYDVTLYTANVACINKYFLEKAELFPSSESEQDSNGQSESIPSSFLSSHGGELCVDSKNKVIVNDLQAQTLQSVKNSEVNGRMDGVPTSSTGDIHTTGFSDYPNNKHINSEHGSIMLPSEMDGARDDDDALTVGSTINVKVSCIESLQKFWCQSTENGDHLRLLMEDLQNHCASTNSQPLVESVCVARNPDNNTWYRAKIITNHNSPVVDVRFIDYGQTRKVPLKDLCPIDPAFLRLKAQAVQCCLFDLRNPTNPTAVSEFEKFVDSSAKSNTRLKCVVKAVTCEEGQLLNMVDIETPSDSVCELLAAQTEVNMHLSHQVPSDAYSYSTHNVEVGGKEKVWITSAENVTHFCCQLERNSHLLEKVNENVEQIISHPQCTDDPPEINSICIARYTDNRWYRGQIVEMSPKFKVHFVDYGDTLAVNKSDIRSFPSDSFAKSIPVQAVQLGLFDIPEEVPHEVNQWFADHASGRSFTISVVAKDAEGKLMVELFNESLNLNMKVRERISVMMEQRTTGFIQQANLQLSNSSEQPSVPNENSALEVEHGMTSDNHEETALAKTFIQDGHSDSEKTPLFLTSSPEGNTSNCRYKRPTISQNQTEEVYATCIVGPHYFWCQYSNAEVLNSVSVLAQEAGQAQQDIMFPETLAPGNPCLALFSADNQWYRAQVIQRNGNTLNVLFVDYGNESDIDIKNVRPIPQSLLDEPPQAFLCSLNGFDESSGSWDDKVYDDFYNLMVDKAVTVTVFDMQNHSEIAVPQYAVKVEFDSVVVHSLMQKYWNPYAKTDMDQTETILQIDSNMSQLNVSRGNVKTCVYKNLNLSKNETLDVYATCIVEPHYFWCQYASSEDLTKLSALVQEAGQVQPDLAVSETFVPGSPCLALFPSDNQWYRAQLIQRAGNALRVLFIDYGNESDVDIINVRSVPQTLLDMPPLAFLCSMDGFDEPKSSWDDQVYDYFYNLLVDKPLRVTVFGVENHSEIAVPQYTVQIQCGNVLVNNALQKHWKPVATEHVMTQSPQTENSLCSGQTKHSAKHLNVSKENACTSTYKKLKMSKNQAECVYASCIVDPHYFWCQYANTEDLNKLSALAQEAGQVPQDMTLSEMLVPGSPCLALFSTDNRWYRAQVIQRNDDTLHVLFIDYGNESDVDISNVRSLPQILLDKAPGAFLCSMNGFDKSKGTWDDQVYDDFYNLLVDKPLRVMISNMEDHSEIAVPQFAVDIECDGVVVNTRLMKYWKELDYSGPE